MQTAYFDLAADLAADSANGWSIGSFGAIGEFVRDRGEEAIIRQETRSLEVVTSRGGLRIAPSQHLAPIAWDSLSSDGESWGHSLAFCVPVPKDDDDVICHLGRDRDALRAEDAGGALFDLGVAVGAVRMCVRSTDAKLLDALLAAEGRPISQCEGLIAEILRAQPHRILLSSAGRIEVFQPIPPPDGHSPIGPHKVVRLNQSLGGFASFDLAVDGDNVTGSARTGRGEIVKLLNIIWRGEYYENAGEVDGVLEGNRLKLHVQWTDGKIGICTIDIDKRGRLSGSVC